MSTEQLIRLYQKTSKHSNYQILPSVLSDIVPQVELTIDSRYESERLEYLINKIDFKNTRIIDVGGNTGYFSFEVLEKGANEVIYIEGNKNHADFVDKAAQQLDKNITVLNKYLDFREPLGCGPVDIVLLFNVIHHLGDDFDDENVTIEMAKEKMVQCINYFHDKTETLILQMGYCWKGDVNHLLFKNGTKSEMIQFIEDAVYDKWHIEHIGIAEVEEDKTVYESPNRKNMERNDSIGEFRNRPIFILKQPN